LTQGGCMTRRTRMAEELPASTWRTGTEFFTILDAHPYHQPVGKVDHKGAGEYRMAYKSECPLCRAQGPAGLRRAETSRAEEERRRLVKKPKCVFSSAFTDLPAPTQRLDFPLAMAHTPYV